MPRFRKKDAFTLTEIIVVVAVIAILTAVIIPNAFKAIEKSQVSKAAFDLKVIAKTALQYYADTGQFPPSDTRYPYGDGFISNTAGIPGWDGPYLSKWPSQPWARVRARPSPYRWRLVDADGDGNSDWVAEIDLGRLSGAKRNTIFNAIDKNLDSGDGSCVGQFRVTPRANGRCPASRRWGMYVVMPG